MTKLLLKLKRSLTTRLLAVFIVTSIIIIVVLAIVIAQGFAQQWRTNAQPHMEQYLDFISEEIGNPPNIENAQALADRLSINIYINGPDVNYSTNGTELDLDAETFYTRTHSTRRFNHVKHLASNNIEFSGNESRTLLKSLVGEYKVFYELPHINREHRHILPVLLIVLAILGMCFMVIKRMLRPVQDIEYGVKQMSTGNLAYRVPIKQNNDLGELANTINTMAAEIEGMLDAKRQLLLGASHELRSPLTRAKVAVQLLEESKASLLIEEDLKEMESLISDILESERMKSGHSALQRGPTELLELVHSVINETQVESAQVNCPAALPLIPLDEVRTRILLRNLIGNAATHHDGNDKPITVNLIKQTDFVEIHILDSGPGIEPEHIEKVTEPFYRTDASRTRSTGGFGLGLHLAKLIAEAHGGSLSIESKTQQTKKSIEGTGTKVVVTLPIR